MVDDLRRQFSIQVSRNNYIKLMRLRHDLFDRLKEKNVIRNVSFDDVITELLINNKIKGE